MKEPYIEGLATHDGPESCAGVREGVGEALTGGNAGRVLSREIRATGCRRCLSKRKAKWSGARERAPNRPCVVRDPLHVWKLHAREPGYPRPVHERKEKWTATERLRP